MRRWIRLPAAASVLFLTSLCAVPVHAHDVVEFDIEGQQRQARVYPGEHADTSPAPLVLVFHGRGDNERNFSRAVGLHQDWPEATVVYPRGLIREDEGALRGWYGATDREDINHDLAFVDRLLEELPKRYRVDPARVYVAGFSNGGRFTFILLAKRPDAFAAFVAIGALSPNVANASQPRPVMYLFGREEPAEYQTRWEQTVISLVRLNRGTGATREWAPGFTEYLSSEGGAQTIISLYNAGHIWPYRGNESIIRFFDAHRIVPPAARAKTDVEAN